MHIKMKHFRIKVLMGLFLLCITLLQGQIKENEALQILSFEEYLGYVKQHHPLLKQANLQLTIGEANLLKSRGGFDPKIEVDYDRKKFKKIEYYNELNATFKIPTWYGVEFKANFEQNSGEFLNPRKNVPKEGLYSAGVSFSVAQGFLINKRMAALKKAKIFIDQSKAERDVLVNNLIFEASKAYFKWIEANNEQQIYINFLTNAQARFNGVKRNVEVGEKAAIDSVEAKITLQNRKLNLEIAKLKTIKAMLNASNYLWVNSVPLEIETNITPQIPDNDILKKSLYLEGITSNTIINNPKLRVIEAKIQGLKIDQSLKRNKLLPKLDFQYNFLNPNYDNRQGYNTANYKAGVNFSIPLFLRKERGDLKLTNIKLQDANFKRLSTSLALQNKIKSITLEIKSLDEQNQMINNIVGNYKTMLTAEERKFELGESSLFLINSREQKLINNALKATSLQVKFLNANAKLYNTLGNASF